MKESLKQDLREHILNLLRNQKEEDRLHKSLLILDKLFNLEAFTKARTVFFYASFNGEVDTFEMIKRAIQLGKTIGLPRMREEKKEITALQVQSLETDLEVGPFGIKQPKLTDHNVIDVKDIDLVIVPGVAFDRQHNRLGRGQGYYDRFLSRISSSTPIIGLAFDFQVVDALPDVGTHDIPVSSVLSN